MKVALIIDNNIEFAPYIYSYYELLKEKYNTTDVLIWNRNNSNYIKEKNGFNVKSIINKEDTKSKFKLLLNKYNFCRKVTKEVKLKKYDRVIVFNEDILMLLGKIDNLVLDNRDLKAIRKDSKFLKKFLKLKLRSVDYVIHASEAFGSYYNETYNYTKNYIFYNIPTELTQIISKEEERENSSTLTIGFIGVIRYIEQLKILINSTLNTNLKVKIAGGGKDYLEIKEYSEKFNHVTIEGKFESSETLKKYNDIDIIYSVYNNLNNNVKLALPNKLAYSIILKKPIIVAKETYLEEVIKQYNIGCSVNLNDEIDLKNKLEYISKNYNKFDFKGARVLFDKKIKIQKELLNKVL